MPKRIRYRVLSFAFSACILTGCSCATTISYTGNLRANATVTSCGSSCSLGAGDTDADYAQYAAVVIPFTVTVPSTMTAITFSYGGGVNGAGVAIAPSGFEPYLSLFRSSGVFLASTYGAGCPPTAHTNGATGFCYDVGLDGGTLTAGTYDIAISAYENLSYAENLGVGKLSDGFTGLGNLYAGEDLHYAFDVTLSPVTTTPTVPEPNPAVLVSSAVALLAAWRQMRFRRNA